MHNTREECPRTNESTHRAYEEREMTQQEHEGREKRAREIDEKEKERKKPMPVSTLDTCGTLSHWSQNIKAKRSNSEIVQHRSRAEETQ